MKARLAGIRPRVEEDEWGGLPVTHRGRDPVLCLWDGLDMNDLKYHPSNVEVIEPRHCLRAYVTSYKPTTLVLKHLRPRKDLAIVARRLTRR